MSSPNKNILWHVSAHGWGHAARQRELIRVFARIAPEVSITVVSSAPEWFWNESPVQGLLPSLPSPTAVEKNGMISPELTGKNLHEFLCSEGELLKTEKSLMEKTGADLVITDMDPLPVKAAWESSIPAVATGNFTWDWILSEMLPGMKAEAERIAGMYSSGTYLRLPMGPDHTPFRKTLDMPLLMGGPPGDPERGKRLLPEDRINCLLAFRELPGGFPEVFPRVINPFTSLPEMQKPGFQNISPGMLKAEGCTFSDLVAAADVVISKPGYGIVSQILTMKKRAILMPAGLFPEEKYLLEAAEEEPFITVINNDPGVIPEICLSLGRETQGCTGGTSQAAGFIAEWIIEHLMQQ